MPHSSKYDFIFLGAGCAALSLVMRMIRSGHFADKKILMIDKESKKGNDRTWCFWEKNPGFFEDIVYKKWNTISFLSDRFSSEMDIHPYQYKMIRSIDFYEYCFREIKQQCNIDLEYGDVTQVPGQKECALYVDGQLLHAGHAIIFNSILSNQYAKEKDINLVQHFKGWMIETPQPLFDSSKAVFMDFRVEQKQDTTFSYVLPVCSTKALVEYTLFSKELLPDHVYENELDRYVRDFLQIKEYRVIEKETGVIPMTSRKFMFCESPQRYNIGTAGGQTKASSGYTFRFIQKQSDLIVESLIKGGSLKNIEASPKRFRFYDQTLLDILYYRTLPGKEIFSRLFAKNDPVQVLKFLDNETTLGQELRLIATLPVIPFFKAAIKQLKPRLTVPSLIA